MSEDKENKIKKQHIIKLLQFQKELEKEKKNNNTNE